MLLHSLNEPEPTEPIEPSCEENDPTPKTIISIHKSHEVKMKKRNKDLIGLFKSCPPQIFDTRMLENTDLMRKNQTFVYLVNCVKKVRQGIFNEIESDKIKDPKPIQNRIREFLFNSLQEAVLMPNRQLKETFFLERLFDWFTNAFKERGIIFTFKNEKSVKVNGEEFDEDWLVRNTYQSNMPLEIDEYQRKLLSTNNLLKEYSQLNCEKQNQKDPSNVNFTASQYSSSGERKLFQNSRKSRDFNSSRLFPCLTQQNFYKNTVGIREQRQAKQLYSFQDQFKKSKASFGEHTTKDFYKSRFGNDKIYRKSASKFNSNRQILLGKIDAIKLGVTISNFKKNDSKSDQFSSPKQNSVFHPLLTGNNFTEIKKNRIRRLQGQRLLNQTASNFYNNISESNKSIKIPKDSATLQKIQIIQKDEKTVDQQCLQKSFIDNFNSDCLPEVQSIDGIGLIENPFDTKGPNKKKKK